MEKLTKLDANQTYKVQYVIPLWLRDEQIKRATARVKARLTPGELTDEPLAVVGYGPSLADTIEQIRPFKKIISCSGAHRMLVDRGIIPTWHLAVDPLPGNTVKLIGQPHKDVKYLIASTCHMDVFDHLEGYDVTLWHVFSTEEEQLRLLPHGEWALTGGCDAGMRAMTIGRFLGHKEQHIFGIDGSCAAGKRHAGEHPVPGKGLPLELNGKTFYTTPAMFESAKMVMHELDMLKDVVPTFYGEGLVQELFKGRVRKNYPHGDIAHIKPELISPEYRKLNTDLHEANLAYGVGGGKHADTVIKLVDSLKVKSVLDYGAGKGYLAKALPFPIWEYDPAVPGKEESPRPADLVVCTDVLEHIEPDKLLFVLGDLARVTKQVGYFVIHTGPSTKKLTDGRNAHLIQEPKEWWAKKLKQFFTVAKIFETGPLLHVVVAPMGKKKQKKVTMSVVGGIEHV